MVKKTECISLLHRNSAGSLIAENLLNYFGGNFFNACSAGSNPAGTPNPFALEGLRNNGIHTSFARTKSWTHFAEKTTPKMDLIVTVCSNADGEV